MGATGWRLTQQRVAGGASPALPAHTASIHTVAVAAAVRRPTAPRVNTQNGRDTPSTTPPAVGYAERERRRGRVGVNLSWFHMRAVKKKLGAADWLTSDQRGSWLTSR